MFQEKPYDNLITTDICAKEYAKLHFPKDDVELNNLYNEGLKKFSDMSQFQDYYRAGSIYEFAYMYLVPMIVQKLKGEREA